MSRFGKNVGAGRRGAFAKRIAFLKPYRKFPSTWSALCGPQPPSNRKWNLNHQKVTNSPTVISKSKG